MRTAICIIAELLLLLFTSACKDSGAERKYIGFLRSVTISSNDEILITGDAYVNSGHSKTNPAAIFEYSKNGSLDNIIYFNQPNTYIYPHSIITDLKGNIFLGGVMGSLPNGLQDGFLTRLTVNGEIDWVNKWHSTADMDENSTDSMNSCVNGITVGENGNIYAVGHAGSNVLFGSDEEGEGIFSDLKQGACIARYLPDGSPNGIEIHGRLYDSITDIAIDRKGNKYLAGYIHGENYSNNSDQIGFFIEKLGPDDTSLWIQSWTYGNKPRLFNSGGFAMDNADGVYITGVFSGTQDFDPGSGFDYRTSNLKYGDYSDDIFLLKCGDSGEYSWVQTWGGADDENVIAVDSDSEGAIYVAGHYQHYLPAGKSDENFVPSQGIYMFLIKYDKSGGIQKTVKWVMGAPDTRGFLMDMAIDSEDSTYLLGWFKGNADFDPGEGEFFMEGEAPFLIKLNSKCEFQWAKIPNLSGE